MSRSAVDSRESRRLWTTNSMFFPGEGDDDTESDTEADVSVWEGDNAYLKLKTYGVKKILLLANSKKIKGADDMNKRELLTALKYIVTNDDFPILKSTRASCSLRKKRRSKSSRCQMEQ